MAERADQHVVGLDVAVSAPTAPSRPRTAADIDAPLTFEGRFARFTGLSARQLARRNPGLAQWCAEGRRDWTGRVCLVALAIVLGVPPGRPTT